MAQRPITVANEFIRQFGAQSGIDHLKLQKLVYFTQGWWMATTGRPLVTERPQVWRYGPVFKSLYSIFSLYRREPITTPKTAGLFLQNTGPLTLEGPEFENERLCVAWVWSEYGALSGTRLSDLTHAIETPWRKLAEQQNFSVPLDTEIPAEADWEYFAALAKERGFEPRPLETA